MLSVFDLIKWLVLVCDMMLFLKSFCLMNQSRTKGEGRSTANKLKPRRPL